MDLHRHAARLSTVAGATLLLLAPGIAAPTLNDAEVMSSPGWSVLSDQFGTKVDYPSRIFTQEEGAPPRGTGRVLHSRDGKARLMVYVEENSAHDNPASFVKSNLAMPRSQIEYERITSKFLVVSGVKGKSIYYSRCNFPDGAVGRIHCIYLSYDASEKLAWDPLVTRMSLSLSGPSRPGSSRLNR